MRAHRSGLSRHAFRFSFLALATVAASALSQSTVSVSQPRQHWTAEWISHPTAPLREALTLHFRRSFGVRKVPEHFIVQVSGDNRFILFVNGQRVGEGPARGDLGHWRYETFVNGQRVGEGPARGDLGHWRYETFDLAPMLRAGDNFLCATVWNFGIYAPIAQMTDRTAFLVQGETAAEAAVDTNEQWLVETEPGQTALPREPKNFWEYMAVGPGEQLHASKYDWEWQSASASGSGWVHAASAVRESIYPGAGIAAPRGAAGDNPWQLVPDSLPAMTYSPETAGGVVRSEIAGANAWPVNPFSVPAHAHVHILLDRSELTTAYPRLRFSGGDGSRIVLTYAEALYDEKQVKDDRNEVGTRTALGMTDLVVPDGRSGMFFEPMWWRTWRYLDLDITTTDSPLTLDGIEAYRTTYPFKQLANFQSSDLELNRIWQIGWHTLELDSHEQLQYAGDARIEAAIAYSVAEDDRLQRQAIRALNDSRVPDGITQSRYPSSLPQFIPPFSLLWIGMVHDIDAYRHEASLVRDMLPGTRTVLAWFARYQRPDGLLRRLPEWSFIDWTRGNDVLPTYDAKGESCLVSLEYIGALEQTIDLETRYGNRHVAEQYGSHLEAAKSGVRHLCWDPARHLVADSPARTIFSEHSTALAVLYDVIPTHQQWRVMNRMLMPGEPLPPGAVRIIPASYYFEYYVARALNHAGLADRYFGILDIWRDLLHQHFTTWPETPGNTRSDSHAWSAHPTYDLLTIVAGIAPASPQFASVRIEPHLGSLTTLDASMPHPLGVIHVHYTRQGPHLRAEIDLPPGVSGSFAWEGQTYAIHGAGNVLRIGRN